MVGRNGVKLAMLEEKADDRLGKRKKQRRRQEIDENQIANALPQGRAELAEILIDRQR